MTDRSPPAAQGSSDGHDRSAPIRIAVSSCLLGEAVRWDGGHKRDGFVVGTLARYFELVSVCPEVGIGLGVPRDPIRLTGTAEAFRVVDARGSGRDFTRALTAYARRMARELGGISGTVFKSASPSCGLAGVKVFSPGGGRPAKAGTGVFARTFVAADPLLPAEEELGLADPERRGHFVERVCAYARCRSLLLGRNAAVRSAEFHARHELAAMFHARHELAAMAHGEAPARRLREQAERARGQSATKAYAAAFMALIARKASRRGHARVLQRAASLLDPALEREDRAALAEAIAAYRAGEVPRIVPLTLLRRQLSRHPHPRLVEQTYLNPSPAELALWCAL